MKEPNRIPLTNNPRIREPQKIPLKTQYLDAMEDDLWDKHEIPHAPPIFSKKNENNKQNNTSSIQQLESDKVD